MSIGKRLIDLARSELNSLLDKANEVDADLHDDRWGGDLEGVSDNELQAELERRRRARDEAEEAAHGPRAKPPEEAKAQRAGDGPREASGRPSANPRPSGARPAPPRRTYSGDEAVRRAYAALEVPPGSDFETVRKAYRRLMRKYHPDLHGGSPEAQRAANDLAQRLTEAYKILDKQLRR
jgi:DnaJ-domain-containing protein 1